MATDSDTGKRLRGSLALAIVAAAGVVLAGCVSITRVDDDASAPPGAPTGPTAAGASSESAAAWPGQPPPSDQPLVSEQPLASVQPHTIATTSPSVSQRPRIGYIALDDSNAFLRSVGAGIRAAAASAGVDLVECTSGWTPEGVMACAEQLGDGDISGLLSFQPYADLAAQVCAATGDVPTVGVVFDQGSCQVSLLHIDQTESGRLAGDAVGSFAAERWACDVSAYLSLESSDADPDGRARMAGYRAGYEEHCPLPGRTLLLDDADRLATAQTQVARLLDDVRGRRIVVVGLNEDAILGAIAAAGAAGRDGQLWYSGQLADPSIREHIACDDQYIASVAQFPERFGDTLVPVLLDALQGAAVPELVDASLELVTAANVRELFPGTPACSE